MFSISNQIAYGGLMVNGVARDDDFPYPDSAWVDVVADAAQGHWVPEEGRAMKQVLAKLDAYGIRPEEIFVVTPFRNVASRAAEVAPRSLVGLKHVGTVHTAQGREADVVVFVLGTARAASGSRDWAAKRPNLVNVAVSRARRRLIVIGNHDAWKGHRYFSDLAAALPVYRWGGAD